MNQPKIYTPYYRVSTREQGNSDLGFAAQREAVRRFVGYDENQLKGEYREVESGKNDRRVQLQTAIDFCKQNGTTLLIAKLDRLSRNASFIFKLRDERVDFVCCDMPDANTLTIGIFATLAQHERELISSRTKAALAELKRQGVKLGSPQNFTQAVRDRGVRAIKEMAKNNPNNKRAKGYIKTLRDNGLTFQKIADKLNFEGFKTSRNKQFTATAVRRLFLSV